MKLFIFPSATTTNIWAGIGAGMWAVKESPDSSRMRELTTKSRHMPVGSLGVLWRTQANFFTTPFIVYSEPDSNQSVTDVWPETWVLPFRIHPLGMPRRRLGASEARQLLPVLRNDPPLGPTSRTSSASTRLQASFLRRSRKRTGSYCSSILPSDGA